MLLFDTRPSASLSLHLDDSLLCSAVLLTLSGDIELPLYMLGKLSVFSFLFFLQYRFNLTCGCLLTSQLTTSGAANSSANSYIGLINDKQIQNFSSQHMKLCIMVLIPAFEDSAEVRGWVVSRAVDKVWDHTELALYCRAATVKIK